MSLGFLVYRLHIVAYTYMWYQSGLLQTAPNCCVFMERCSEIPVNC